MTATPDLVLREAIRPGIARLTLNRPDKRNALSVALMESVLQALDAIEADSGNRILLLEGAGPSFCAGLDLAEAAETAKHHRSSELVSTLLQRLATSRLVTFALVRGSALGGGAGLMSACDFALADPGATIGYPEPRRGIVAALVMIFLRRQLAERDARKLLLTGEPITGAEAERRWHSSSRSRSCSGDRSRSSGPNACSPRSGPRRSRRSSSGPTGFTSRRASRRNWRKAPPPSAKSARRGGRNSWRSVRNVGAALRRDFGGES